MEVVKLLTSVKKVTIHCSLFLRVFFALKAVTLVYGYHLSFGYFVCSNSTHVFDLSSFLYLRCDSCKDQVFFFVIIL
jgi:aminoglycoside N3'-acetyltransferase